MKFSFAFILVPLFLLIQTYQFSSASQDLLLASAVRANKLAPALYVFGDSLVDSGNNNYLKTLAKVNYTPYGIDFPNGASGRFTNGYTTVDYLAAWLGLPFVPPFLGLSKVQKGKITTGINYASGAAGILPESGTATISTYMATSIFVVVIGNNDYINNYLQPTRYNSSKLYTPQQYAALLVSTLKQHLTSVYNLGARKFVVFELGPIGCLPSIVNSITPKPVTPCVEGVNSLIQIFNLGITNMIQELTSTLKGSTFVHGDIFEKVYQQDINPLKYGFTGGNTPCCSISNASSLCLPNQTPCKNRNVYLHWDGYHPTQRVNYEIANGCFRGLSTCFPINVHKLACL
ncbi:hypothetical protein C5167_044592 [Papaver somniferum]|uniref:Uncharacterized protein n=1 Tax=Papaver somniferum TaxID=3469 RepID=A0A4Y7L956_PAPSO|nr:hypothetical protein C5167_044592 [Papaver somniferum]